MREDIVASPKDRTRNLIIFLVWLMVSGAIVVVFFLVFRPTTDGGPPAKDTTPPNATLKAEDVTKPSPTHTIVVTYLDDVKVKAATLSKSNLLVTGPNAYRQSAEFVSADKTTDDPKIVATYRIGAPKETWSPADNGVYSVEMDASQVTDTSGNAVPAGNLGTFRVAMSRDGFTVIPFITWGGDTATFYANGGLETKPGTIYDKLGLKIELVNGDDFAKQVENYLARKTDFLRGTFSMLGLASEKINGDPRNQAVVFLQLTWSAGDHMVAREGLRTLNDLKGKRIALQNDGPHVGMLNDTLRTAALDWKDITPVWVDDLSGDKGPAARFRADSSIDACFVISPDMVALTGGLTSVGAGGKTVRGAHVLNSTAWMSRSICDVYACRKEFYDANRDFVEKFVAGFLKASEDVVRMRDAYEDKRPSVDYTGLLKLSKVIFGDAATPSEADAHGMILDCSFVRLPGNFSFFNRDSNRSGFKFAQQDVLALAMKLRKVNSKKEFLKAEFDEAGYEKIKGIGNIRDPVLAPPRPPIDPKKVPIPSSHAELGKITVYSFTIPFEEGRTDFPVAEYGDSFQRAIDQAALWRNAVILVRGHADPFVPLNLFVKAGTETGDIERQGSSGDRAFTWKPTGQRLDLADTPTVVALIRESAKNKSKYNGADFQVDQCLQLSEERVNNVKAGCAKYAKSTNIDLDESQIITRAVGIEEPVVPLPRTPEDQRKNRRVEFRLITIPPEAVPKDVYY